MWLLLAWLGVPCVLRAWLGGLAPCACCSLCAYFLEVVVVASQLSVPAGGQAGRLQRKRRKLEGGERVRGRCRFSLGRADPTL